MANVIQEFLVGLGVDIDDGDVRKFNNTLDEMGKGAAELGAAIAATAVAVTAAVTKIASDFDGLYWTSKNLGSSAGDVRAIGYAFSQLGGNVGDAGAALKSISNFTMTYGDGANGFLARLGVDPRDIGDAAATFRDLEGIFQRMSREGPNGTARAVNIAGAIGLSPDQVRIMLRDTGEFEAQLQAFAQKAGLNFDDATQSGNDFMTQLRLIRAEFDMLLDAKGVAVLKKIEPYLEGIATKLASMPADKMEIAGDVIAGAFGAIALAAVAAYGPIIAVAGAITLALKAYQDWEKGDPWIKLRDQTAKEKQEMQRRAADPSNPYGKGFWGGLKAMWNSPWASVHEGAAPASPPAGQAGKPPVAAMGSAKQAIAFFKAQGLDDAHANGIAAMLYSENSVFDPNGTNPLSGARGIAQWLSKDRIADFKAFIGHDLRHSTFGEQLRFVEHELKTRYKDVWAQMRRAGDAMSVAAIGIHGYEAPGLGEIGDMRRASHFLGNPFETAPLGVVRGGVSINQNNTYNIHGGDTREVMSGVSDSLQRSNQKLADSSGVYQW